jgi:hypothetical protein
MTSASDSEYPPVRVLTVRHLKGLLERRLSELRAKGIPYEVIHLDGEEPADEGGGEGRRPRGPRGGRRLEVSS